MKKKYLSIMLIILVCVLVCFGATYAVYTEISDDNSTIDFGTSNLESIIRYKNDGTFDGELNFGTDYTSGIKSSVVFYNGNSDVDLKGHLYLDLIDFPDSISEEKAFKWTVVRSGSSALDGYSVTGDFEGYKNGDSIDLLGSFDLSKEAETFDVYIWIDSNIGVSDVSLKNRNLNVSIRAYGYQAELDK